MPNIKLMEVITLPDTLRNFSAFVSKLKREMLRWDFLKEWDNKGFNNTVRL